MTTPDAYIPDSVIWNGTTIPFRWCHSRRKTVVMTVRPDKSIVVRAPLRTSGKMIRSFVEARAEWVMKVWQKLDALPPRLPQEYADGASFMYQGKELRLTVTTGVTGSVRISGECLLLTAPEPHTAESIRRRVDQWYKKEARRIVAERAAACHLLVREEQLPLPPITIRAMKSRWGSYSYRTRRISLNLNLIKAPQRCLDYVIIHELCHIKVRHHGTDFWDMVARYQPDYKTLRTLLKQYS